MKNHTVRTSKPGSGSFFGDGKVAVGAIFGVAICLLLYLLFFRPSLNSASENSFVEIITLLVAMSSVYIAANALSEQRKTRQAGTDPVIILHLGAREDARILSTLEIRNVGSGAALNVKTTLETDISHYTPGRIMTDLTSLQTIKTIPQDHSVSYNLGLGYKLLAEPKIEPLMFKVSYTDIDGNEYHSSQEIDPVELSGQRADEGLLSRSTKSLEKIEKSLSKISKHPELHVVMETQKEYESRIQSRREEMLEWMKEQKET